MWILFMRFYLIDVFVYMNTLSLFEDSMLTLFMRFYLIDVFVCTILEKCQLILDVSWRLNEK
jgi:hypothetical protein